MSVDNPIRAFVAEHYPHVVGVKPGAQGWSGVIGALRRRFGEDATVLIDARYITWAMIEVVTVHFKDPSDAVLCRLEFDTVDLTPAQQERLFDERARYRR